MAIRSTENRDLGNCLGEALLPPGRGGCLGPRRRRVVDHLARAARGPRPEATGGLDSTAINASDIEESIGSIPAAWARAIGPAASPERLAPIAEFVAARRRATTVLPEREWVFAALEATPPDTVQAVILGQDPYPNRKHATGLAFSVPADLEGPLPPSLRRIRAELQSDRQ